MANVGNIKGKRGRKTAKQRIQIRMEHIKMFISFLPGARWPVQIEALYDLFGCYYFVATVITSHISHQGNKD